MKVITGLQADSTSPSLNLPIIPTFRDIANLIECVAMFYFIKGLSVFRIATEPCADCFLLFGGLTVGLHHALESMASERDKIAVSGFFTFHRCQWPFLCDIREMIEQWTRHNPPNVRNFS